MEEFTNAMLDYWRDTGRAFGRRGWCYWLEGKGLINKGQFDSTGVAIDNRRKDGTLPTNICTEDEARLPDNLEQLDECSPEQFAYRKVQGALHSAQFYDPVSFWEFQGTYVEMTVEKIDLVVLFRELCAEYHIPISNIKGSPDINMRVKAIERFNTWRRKGKKCVLLHWGDFDPPGVKIAENLKGNFAELGDAVVEKNGKRVSVGYREKLFDIVHVGLSADQVEELKLTWIEGLKTGSGENLANPTHPKHKEYNVAGWIKKYGENKVEANALVGKPDDAIEECRNIILRYVKAEGIAKYERHVERERARVRDALPDAMREALREER
jgi:hypothetical protein